MIIGANLLPALVTALFCAAATWMLLPPLIRRLVRSRMLDEPGERSNHEMPTPRGGGLAIVAPLAVAWAELNLLMATGAAGWAALAGFVLLAFVSWRDDRSPQPVALRLAAQALAVVLPLALLPDSLRILPEAVPVAAERIAIAFAWVWFVNLYNFMDGLDALAAGQAVTAAAGALLVLALAGMPAAFAVAPPLAAGLAAGALAFLPRNWPPARVFLGDVGSIPLGYLLAWLLLALAYAGHAVPALILPLYFVFDATFTLLSRLLRGASVFDAHSEHLYQRARRGGKSHLWVTVRALAANVLFAGLAVLAVRFPFSALLAASPVLVGLAAIYLCAARTRPVSADRLGRP